MSAPAVEFRGVDIFFGDCAGEARKLAGRGKNREEILEQTGTVLGVTDCSLVVEHGEICVLMGLSGSGKSTLLRAVNGLNRVTGGEVLVSDGDGVTDIVTCDAATLRRLRMNRVAMVFQQFALLPWRTVAENVGFGLELRGIARAERESIVREKLALVHLEQWADKYAHELSGGMQQRVGLARAFATDADILLMDEPFSALDPLIRTHLQDELLALQRSLRKTIIFVSHDLDEAIKIGTHIAIMEGGRIVQSGAPEEIVLNPASPYVADFVAHMNPLQVLTCGSLMRRVERTPLPGNVIQFEGAVERLAPQSEVVANPQLSLNDAIRIRQRTGRPVLIGDAGALIGIIGDDEIYSGIVRQTGKGESAPDQVRFRPLVQ